MTNLHSILKSRIITLPTKVRLVKSMVFPVVMYWCESWTTKKAECQKIDAFELWCWRRLFRVPWTARRSHQSILKEISPGCSLEGLMLQLKLQYFWPSDEKSWLIGKDPDAGKDWGREEKRTAEDEMVGWLPGVGTRDPTHDKVMRRRPDKQGRSGPQGFRKAAPALSLKMISVFLMLAVLDYSLISVTQAEGLPRSLSKQNQPRTLINMSHGRWYPIRLSRMKGVFQFRPLCWHSSLLG